MATQRYPIHPYAELFPLHDGKPLWDLRDDINKHGQIEPITLFHGQILDGRRREVCLAMLGKEPTYTHFTGTDAEALAFVISKNLKRRHLGEAERAMVAAKIANLKNGQNKSPSPVGGASTRAEAAELMNVSERAVDRAKAVQANGTPALQEAVRDGTMSLSAAAKVSQEPPKDQNQAVKQARKKKAPAKQRKRIFDWAKCHKGLGFTIREIDNLLKCCPQEAKKVARLKELFREAVNLLKPHATGKAHLIYQGKDGPADWEEIVRRSRVYVGGRTFHAAEGLFAHEHQGAYPDRHWPLMPMHEDDFYRLVSDVPVSALIPKP